MFFYMLLTEIITNLGLSFINVGGICGSCELGERIVVYLLDDSGVYIKWIVYFLKDCIIFELPNSFSIMSVHVIMS